MKKIHRILMIALLPLLLNSCFHTGSRQEEIKLREFSSQDEDLGKKTASVFAESFLLAVADNNFAVWQKNVPPHAAAKLDSSKFAAMRTELLTVFGNFEKGSFLGSVASGNLRTYLWKMSFSKEENGKKVLNEVVFFVRVFCAEGKAPAISTFGVKLL